MLSVPEVMNDIQDKRRRCSDIRYEVYQFLGSKDLGKTLCTKLLLQTHRALFELQGGIRQGEQFYLLDHPY